MSARDADQKAEMPERARRVGGGTAEGTGGVRQADTAHEGYVGEKAAKLMEEVCERRNLIAAHARGVRNGGAPGVDGMCVDELDQWLRRKLRVLIWRQWKRPRTRFKRLVQHGLEPARAAASAYNGRGPWWNAGAGHMNLAVPTSLLRQKGLLSLPDSRPTGG